MAPYPNDCRYYYAYSYDFENDKEVTNEELLAMHNLTADQFVEEAYNKGQEYFMNMANSVGMTDPEEIEFYLADAREDTTADLPMYLDENGVLNEDATIENLKKLDVFDDFDEIDEDDQEIFVVEEDTEEITETEE